VSERGNGKEESLDRSGPERGRRQVVRRAVIRIGSIA